ALDRADDHLADGLGARLGEQGTQDAHTALHGVGRHQHLRHEQDAVAKVDANDAHAFDQRIGQHLVGRPAPVEQDLSAFDDLLPQSVVQVVVHLLDEFVVIQGSEVDLFLVGFDNVFFGHDSLTRYCWGPLPPGYAWKASGGRSAGRLRAPIVPDSPAIYGPRRHRLLAPASQGTRAHRLLAPARHQFIVERQTLKPRPARGQNRPVVLPDSSRRMRVAAGTRGSPGMVMMSPQITTRKPAPAARRTSRTGTT